MNGLEQKFLTWIGRYHPWLPCLFGVKILRCQCVDFTPWDRAGRASEPESKVSWEITNETDDPVAATITIPCTHENGAWLQIHPTNAAEKDLPFDPKSEHKQYEITVLEKSTVRIDFFCAFDPHICYKKNNFRCPLATKDREILIVQEEFRYLEDAKKWHRFIKVIIAIATSVFILVWLLFSTWRYLLPWG